MWDENGDTFVYVYMRGCRTKPPPSFRINSRVIEGSGSKTFIDQLFNTAEPEGWPRFYPHDATAGISSPEDAIKPYENYPNGFPSGMRTPMSDGDALRPLDVSKRFTARAPWGIQHEIYVPWPGTESGIPSTLWHITTRNFFAVMYDASSLVGTTLQETFSKLFERVSMYPDYLDPNISKVAWITDYIMRHKFDDVRNNPSYAASLLAFSETPGVQWREGYIEAFVHCAGMVNMGLQTTPEWRNIAPHTMLFLQNAGLEMEERIHRAQAFLLSFDFTEMWPTTSAPPSTARGCFDRFRKWLCKYYENAFLHWPPTNEHTWLTRDMVMRLRNDFHGLYDYLVDRDVIFDGTQYRPRQRWAIVSSSGQALRADTNELPLTEILLSFDDRHNCPHIPHPYPVVPPSTPVQHKIKSAFMLKKPTSAPDGTPQTRRKALSYAEASNVYTLRDQYMHTDLVTNFIHFEQSDMIDTLDPFEARRGRWILIYGVLQVLATISVDNPNLRFTEDVQYHLCPQMKGVLPWTGRSAPTEAGSEHTRSHCWTVPATWGSAVPKARASAHKPIIWGQFGDGRSRGESTEQIPQLKTRDRSNSTSIGRQRAEEWVATNGGTGGAADIGSDGGTTLDTMDGIREGLESSVGNTRSGSGTAATVVTRDGTSSGEYGGGSRESPDEGAQAARRRRALIHGFTDFQVPSEW